MARRTGTARGTGTGNAAVTSALRALIVAELALDARGTADAHLQARVDEAKRHYDEVRGINRDDSRR